MTAPRPWQPARRAIGGRSGPAGYRSHTGRPRQRPIARPSSSRLVARSSPRDRRAGPSRSSSRAPARPRVGARPRSAVRARRRRARGPFRVTGPGSRAAQASSPRAILRRWPVARLRATLSVRLARHARGHLGERDRARCRQAPGHLRPGVDLLVEAERVAEVPDRGRSHRGPGPPAQPHATLATPHRLLSLSTSGRPRSWPAPRRRPWPATPPARAASAMPFFPVVTHSGGGGQRGVGRARGPRRVAASSAGGARAPQRGRDARADRQARPSSRPARRACRAIVILLLEGQFGAHRQRPGPRPGRAETSASDDEQLVEPGGAVGHVTVGEPRPAQRPLQIRRPPLTSPCWTQCMPIARSEVRPVGQRPAGRSRLAPARTGRPAGRPAPDELADQHEQAVPVRRAQRGQLARRPALRGRRASLTVSSSRYRPPRFSSASHGDQRLVDQGGRAGRALPGRDPLVRADLLGHVQVPAVEDRQPAQQRRSAPSAGRGSTSTVARSVCWRSGAVRSPRASSSNLLASLFLIGSADSVRTRAAASGSMASGTPSSVRQIWATAGALGRGAGRSQAARHLGAGDEELATASQPSLARTSGPSIRQPASGGTRQMTSPRTRSASRLSRRFAGPGQLPSRRCTSSAEAGPRGARRYREPAAGSARAAPRRGCRPAAGLVLA